MPITPYVDPLSLHLDASLATPLGPEFRTSILSSPEPSIFAPMPIQIDTSTQLDLPLAILRGKRLRRPRLLPPPPPLFPAPTPSWTDILHVSHAVPTTIRNERQKMKRVSIIHKLSPYGGMRDYIYSTI